MATKKPVTTKTPKKAPKIVDEVPAKLAGSIEISSSCYDKLVAIADHVGLSVTVTMSKIIADDYVEAMTVLMENDLHDILSKVIAAEKAAEKAKKPTKKGKK